MIPARTRLDRVVRIACLAAALAVAASGARAAGIDNHPDADAADVGLPLYPGAVKKPSKGEEHAGLSFGLWGGAFGMKLVAVSYASKDGLDAVSAFYRDALAKYGPVVDCSQNRPKNARRPKDASSRGITIDSGSDKADGSAPVVCGDDGPDVAGGRLYKVGTKNDQRVFEVEPGPGGVSFDLVHLQLRGTD